MAGYTREVSVPGTPEGNVECAHHGRRARRQARSREQSSEGQVDR
jgi:hypothetical protein